jgi:group II intron reverse transcriptase/maturase
MQRTEALLDIYQKRGARGLPLERVYRHLFDPELFLRAYGRIYRNDGSMTKGTTDETVDGMSLQKIHDIIEQLKLERYQWTPVRRTEIPKGHGKPGKRPLGIPTWSNKLVQEAARSLLEPYYEQRFSTHSHGFRPKRGCQSALFEIQKRWKGTVWFIEGDISKCFDSIDHSILLKIIRRDIHDGRIIALIDGMLKAGYMEDWRYSDTMSGTPQGGIISPLLSNIYLNELDKFVEGTLIPMYTAGTKRQRNPEYARHDYLIACLRQQENFDRGELRKLKQEQRRLTCYTPVDPSYRRLRYVRYADDFLLGFVGPKDEAEEIRRKLGEFLQRELKLTLSPEKTLITHATDDKAKFLGYEIKVVRKGDLISANGRRATNGRIALLMPWSVFREYRQRYSKKGKIVHRKDLLNDSDYTIIQRYQGILKGLYNYYCMATNVSKRLGHIKWVLNISLVKTLASKFKRKIKATLKIYKRHTPQGVVLTTEIKRNGKEPLVATFGGFPVERIPEGMGVVDFSFTETWFRPGSKRSEVVQRLISGKCELCDAKDVPVQVHHIRKLADIDRPGRRPKATWEKIMSARRRKTLVVCEDCHRTIHAGRYDGPRI